MRNVEEMAKLLDEELSESYCKFVHMGNGILMRDLVNTARTIEHVRSHDMDRLREAIGLDEQLDELTTRLLKKIAPMLGLEYEEP